MDWTIYLLAALADFANCSCAFARARCSAVAASSHTGDMFFWFAHPRTVDLDQVPSGRRLVAGGPARRRSVSASRRRLGFSLAGCWLPGSIWEFPFFSTIWVSWTACTCSVDFLAAELTIGAMGCYGACV